MYELLSYHLEDRSPVHPSLEDVSITINTTVGNDGYETHTIRTSNHAGTHIDAPAHFIEGGRRISEYSIDDLIFNEVSIIEVDAGPGVPIGKDDIDVVDCELLIIKTGFGSRRGEDVYLRDNPWIDPELIDHIRRNFKGIRAIGIDCISISTSSRPSEGRMAHLNAFMERREYGDPLLLIEDMKLDSVREVTGRVFAVPWMLGSVDSAPCTVIAELR